MITEDYDVIVVGAGPAGSSAARAVAEKGASVLLVERKKEIGAPVRCGEGIALKWVTGLGLKPSPKAISYKINGSVLFSPDMKKALRIRNEETKGFMLDRKVFDKELAGQAARAGAEIAVKAEVMDVVREGGNAAGVIIDCEGEEITVYSKIIIAADGAESHVARMAGIDTTATLYNTDFGIEYEMENVECEDMIEIYYSREYAPRGYAWVFPKGADSANIGVGIGGLEKGFAMAYLKKFLKSSERFAKAQPVALKGGAIPVEEPIKKMVGNGIMVVGTAAHQVDPIHGGGIGLAIEAGQMAGAVAAKCAAAAKCDAASLAEYETRWRAKRGALMSKRFKLRKVLERLTDDDMNAIFEYLDENDLQLVLDYNFAPVVKKVLLKRPQLLKVLSALL